MHICGLVNLAEGREDTKTKNTAYAGGMRGKSSWVTAEAMEDWLVEVGFVEELFGFSMHVELVSSAQYIKQTNRPTGQEKWPIHQPKK